MFDRMVQMTKRCLRKMVGRDRLTDDELITALVEVEGIIHSRPPTYVTTDDSAAAIFDGWGGRTSDK